MTLSREHLIHMGSAEGAAAADGLATLLRHLMTAGVVTEETVTAIRDQMLQGLDPSVAGPDERGLQVAYSNVAERFRFLSAPLPPQMEDNGPKPEWQRPSR